MVFFAVVSVCWSQNIGTEKPVLGIRVDGDTIVYREIPPVYVYPRSDFRSKRYEKQYWRLVQKVKKVYPYAKKANELLLQYTEQYEATQDKRLRRKYVKQAEEALFGEYGPQLKKLTISEGRILIKLIDRQTGSNSYELIQDLKGGLVAFFWQGVARVFGNDLKSEYDPEVEDRIIEEIIFYIDAGIL
ncbi:MAG: hypothetical protein A2W90_08015 [Bacteroidetes bacterium GWF2_42_66]|nr:MAG: hypothetical protein A2W92_20640 [Bacteroidetes bacterium GWA2_42_15]OFX99765.1 MAG: hypothetical protein A2W89_03180 [Bacteroidetes bacterium GWE2_42_39]OFY39803.1 MAG: hypothetical protein A2W90_08015 [Bacteroidetes bacterium GWF2_42_66]